MPYIVTDECMLCGACVVGCPSGAIEEGDTQCHINVALCLECGTCEQNCPSGAIIFVELELDQHQDAESKVGNVVEMRE